MGKFLIYVIFPLERCQNTISLCRTGNTAFKVMDCSLELMKLTLKTIKRRRKKRGRTQCIKEEE